MHGLNRVILYNKDVCKINWLYNNNNNEYLQRLTRTGPKRLHVLYKYIIIVKIQRIQHECTHKRTHTHRLAYMHTHTRLNEM